MDAKFYVGQEVIVRNVNEGRGSFRVQTAPVTRVGTRLVYIEQYGREYSYRADTGRRNDNYGHSWLQTHGEYMEEKRRAALYERLAEHGMRSYQSDWAGLSSDKIERILAILEEPDVTAD